MELGEEANGQQVDVSLEAELTLRLSERPTTGFRWQPLSLGEPVLHMRGDDTELAAGVGGTAWRVWHFVAAQPGNGTIELAYRRAWEASADPTRRFSLRVRVT